MMDRDEVVCNCMGVTAGEIIDAINSGAEIGRASCRERV